MSAAETDDKDTPPSTEPAGEPGTAGATAAGTAGAAPPSGDAKSSEPSGDARPRQQGRLRFRKETRCPLCREKVTRVDYKDVTRLQSFCRTRGRIQARRRSGNCSRHQRMVKIAIKQARYLALLSYVEGDHRVGRQGRSW